MIKRIWRQLKNNTVSSLFIIVSYAVAILVISISLSNIIEYKYKIKEYKGSSYKKFANIQLSKEISFDEILKALNNNLKECKIGIQNLPIVIKNDKKAVDWACEAVMYFKEASKLPLVKGRDFTVKESMSSEKLVIVGRTFSSYIFKDLGEYFILINGEKFKVIGVMGAKNRDTNWDTHIYVPINAINNETKTMIPKLQLINLRIEKENNFFEDEIKNLKMNFLNLDRKSKVILKMDENIARNYDNLKFLLKRHITIIIFMMIIATVNIIYSVIYWVYKRVKEIYVRRAIGATNLDIIKLIYSEFIGLSILGTMIGLILQLLFTNIFKEGLRYIGMSVYVSWITYLISFIFTLLSGVIATCVPLEVILNKKELIGIKES